MLPFFRISFLALRDIRHVRVQAGCGIAVAIALLSVLCALNSTALGAGPSTVAVIDRSTWKIDSPANFDAASLAENVLFAESLFQAWEKVEGGTAEKALGVKKANRGSLELWKKETMGRLQRNIKAALASCKPMDLCKTLAPPQSETDLKGFAASVSAKLAAEKREWHTSASAFYPVYVAEQMRLAALFPNPTSEILSVAPGEVLGFELPDRSFLLTFDDGPTSAAGETDKIAEMLRANNANGVFFVMRDPFLKRVSTASPLALRSVYEKQCLGVHGSEHKPHPKLVKWESSLEETWSAIKMINPDLRLLFRPPYGQRNEEISKFVHDKKGEVILWNIDSQDWSKNVPAERAADRVLSLMLLWRKGVILFHDVHAKARVALPNLFDAANAAKLTWKDCHDLL